MSEDICDDEQMEDTSRTVEDIPKDQHTGTKAKSDGSNFKIAALESSVAIRAPEGQSASSTPVHDAQHPRHTPGVTSSPSRQLINVNNKVKSTDSLRGTTFHPANDVNGSERLASINGEIMTSADSANGVSNARAQPKDICNGKDKFVSSNAVHHNPTKPLVDQPLSSSSTNKESDKQQLMESPNNISSDQQNNDTKNKELVLTDLIKSLKKHAAQNVSKHAPSKTLGSANNDILSDMEPLSSPTVSKTSNEQPMNPQFTSKSSEDQGKQCPGVNKTSGEKPTGTANTTRVLVHAVNSHDSDVPVDHTATVLKRQSQSVAHLSAITTGTDLLNGQHSCFSLVDNKCTEMAAGSPSAKKALLTKEALTSREEIPPTSPGIPGKASKVQNATCHPSPLHKEAFSKGFPANVGKPMNLGIDQKSKLMESYKEAEKQMSRTGDTTKAAQAFWNLCRENKCREFLLTRVTCYMKSVFYTIVHEESKDRDFEQAFAFLQASGCFDNFMNGTKDDQAKINSRTTSRETYNEGDSDSVGSCTEVEDQGEITRDEDHAGMESGSPESFQMSSNVGQCTRDEGHNRVEAKCSKTSLSVNGKEKESSRDEDHNGMQSELSESSLESNRKEESCRGEDHDDIQSELSESSLESNRKEESCRGEDHDDIQSELCESCSESSRKKQSTEGEYIDRMETEFPAASLFSPSASRESDLILPENASRRHRSLEKIKLKTMKTNLRVLNSQLQTLQYQLQQQTEDGDAGFATNLIQFLRKVPEDKKLSTQVSILNVLSSILGQQPMSISNPGCVPQQYTNPSSPRLSGQTLPPKP